MTASAKLNSLTQQRNHVKTIIFNISAASKKEYCHKNKKGEASEPPMTISEPPAIKVTHKNTLFTIIYRQGDRRTNHKPKYKHEERRCKRYGRLWGLFDDAIEKVAPKFVGKNE